MGRRGPAPAPTNLVVLRGGKTSTAKRPPEPKPKPLVDVKPPAGLSSDAEKLWRSLAPELARVGLLTLADVPTFESLCELYAIVVACRRSVRKGRGYTVTTKDRTHGGELRRHPSLLTLKQYEDSFRAAAKEFGLTPSARVGLPAPADDADAEDDL